VGEGHIEHSSYRVSRLYRFWSFIFISDKTTTSSVGGEKTIFFSLTHRDLIRRRIDAVVNCAVITDRSSGKYDAHSPLHRINVEGARHLATI